MLQKIKSFFESNINVDNNNDIDHQLRLATAALMVEMMLDDGKVHQDEEKVLKEKLQHTFKLNEAETSELFSLAHDEVKEAVDYHQFTSLIAKNYTQEQKIKVIENLWAVAYADNKLDQYEEVMVRRIADLIYVTHSEFMQAKHRVLNNKQLH